MTTLFFFFLFGHDRALSCTPSLCPHQIPRRKSDWGGSGTGATSAAFEHAFSPRWEVCCSCEHPALCRRTGSGSTKSTPHRRVTRRLPHDGGCSAAERLPPSLQVVSCDVWRVTSDVTCDDGAPFDVYVGLSKDSATPHTHCCSRQRKLTRKRAYASSEPLFSLRAILAASLVRHYASNKQHYTCNVYTSEVFL
jgi:hypothetical protein